MLQRIKKWLGIKHKDYVSHLAFRENIVALGMEIYKGITVIYLKNVRGETVYHFFYKKEFFSEAIPIGLPNKLEDIEPLAHKKIDSLK